MTMVIGCRIEKATFTRDTGRLLSQLEVPTSDIQLNTFVRPAEPVLPETSAFEVQGTRQVAYDLDSVLGVPASRKAAAKLTSDPILRSLVKDYADEYDKAEVDEESQQKWLRIRASKLFDGLKEPAADVIKKQLAALGLEMPDQDGIPADQVFIKMAIAYATSPEKNPNGMYCRPGACE